MENKILGNIKVLLLGTYHFDPQGGDLHNLKVSNMLSPEKQAEIKSVADKLAEFKPTKIAIEIVPSRFEETNALYRDYFNGKRELRANEIEQLGFRLAKQLKHTSIYPIDENHSLPLSEMLEHAEKHNPTLYKWHIGTRDRYKEEDRLLKTATVGEFLKYLNQPECITKGHNWYVNMAAVGAGDTWWGANCLSAWYERNIRIFANLQNIAEDGDRILIIYGAGHKAILSELIQSTSNMELVDTLQYIE